MPKLGKFRKKNENFIETGSLFGDGIDLALVSGFSKVVSIEIDEKLYLNCVEKFKQDQRVELIFGDSSVELKKYLDKNPSISFTYWLDGHYSGGITGIGNKEYPIIEELDAILKRNILNEIIYIDDLRLLRDYSNDINLELIKNMCLRYKPNCNIEFEASAYDPFDIMIIEY